MSSFRVPDDGRVHLLLVHGSAIRQGFDRVAAVDAADAPFSPETAARCGFACCLAGHYHNGWHEAGVVYPGSPEPLGWRATGRHAAAVVTVDGERVDVELVEIGRLRYISREVECGGVRSSAEATSRIEAAVADLDAATTCLRVVLTGQIDAGCAIDQAALVEALGAPFAAFDLRDRTVPAFDHERLAARDDVAGLFVRALRGMAARADTARDREMAALALDIGLHALAGRKQVARVD
jgi:DNA repair exonuclease SbcCD nuclease subunit